MNPKSRFIMLLAAPLLLGGLVLGSVAAAQGGPQGPCTSGQLCVNANTDPGSITDLVEDITLENLAPQCEGAATDAVLPGALAADEVTHTTFELRNTGDQPVDVGLTLGWQNTRVQGAAIDLNADPILAGRIIPTGTYSSPGMAGYLLLADDVGHRPVLVAESLRGSGTRTQDPLMRLAPHSTTQIVLAVGFNCAANRNDTQAEKVAVNLGVKAAAAVTPTPPATAQPTPGAPTPPATAQPTPGAPAPSASTQPTPAASAPATPGKNAPSQPGGKGLSSTGVNLTAAAVGVSGLVVTGGLLLLVRRRNRRG
ncbi:RodZ family helix-turn-helix domain-containing protein [Actinomyces bovis]|uniref:hypothetical protein n=1 Tax=Actinomyces bovis TaxID=1658 RepID=UPI000F82901F|nr:hypothetical protein [Actinomyces bovis]